MAKRLSLIFMIVAASLATWAVAHSWLAGTDRFTSIGAMVPLAIAFVVLASVVSLAWLLLERTGDRVAAIGLSGAAFMVFWSPNIWYVVVLLLFALAWVEASRRIRQDISERRTLNMHAGLDRGVRLVLIGAFLMVSLGFYLSPASRLITVNSVSSDITTEVLKQVPASQRAQIQVELGKQISSQMHTWLGSVGQYLAAILAFVLFLALMSVSFVFRELALGLSIVLFSLLRRTGFVGVESKAVQAEVVSL